MYLSDSPFPPSHHFTEWSKRKGEVKDSPYFFPRLPKHTCVAVGESLLSVLDFVRHLIREVYVYSQFTLPYPPPSSHPPSERHGAQGDSGPSAEWRIKASHIPPALISLHHLGSAVSSPVTLPYNNLEGREIKVTTRTNFNQRNDMTGSRVKSTQMCWWKVFLWIRKFIWEQNVSLLVNELGASSFPEESVAVEKSHIPNRLVSCVDQEMVGLHAVAGRQAVLQ